jgi:RHS repeat-associated protein
MVVTGLVYRSAISRTRQENRLIKSILSGIQTEYLYDGQGTLLQKTVTQGATTSTTKYVGEIYEKRVSGAQTTITKYYWFNGQRVAMRENGTRYFFVNDHLGSPVTVLDDGGGVVSQLKYYAYGRLRNVTPSGSEKTDKLFTGHQLEKSGATDLYYMKARFYDPLLGRFMAADSIVPNPADPQSLNRYSYVLGNPLRYTDPTGHNPYESCRPGIDCPGDVCVLWCAQNSPESSSVFDPCRQTPLPAGCFDAACAQNPGISPWCPGSSGGPVCNQQCQVEAALEQNPGLVCLSPAVAHLCAGRAVQSCQLDLFGVCTLPPGTRPIQQDDHNSCFIGCFWDDLGGAVWDVLQTDCAQGIAKVGIALGITALAVNSGGTLVAAGGLVTTSVETIGVSVAAYGYVATSGAGYAQPAEAVYEVGSFFVEGSSQLTTCAP